MIKARDGRKVSPREKAREIIMDGATNISLDPDGMTPREINLVIEVLEKELNRLADKWGYIEINLDYLRRRFLPVAIQQGMIEEK